MQTVHSSVTKTVNGYVHIVGLLAAKALQIEALAVPDQIVIQQ